MPSYVYFMTDRKRVKIGKADDVDERLSTFNTAHAQDLIVLGTIRCRSSKAAMKLEGELHEKFKTCRVREDREWFRPCPNLLWYMIQQGFNILPLVNKVIWEGLRKAVDI